MKTYRYEEPGPHGEIIQVIINEDQIIAKYWNYWCDRMKEAGKEKEISRQSCIDDFVIIHWAYEI